MRWCVCSLLLLLGCGARFDAGETTENVGGSDPSTSTSTTTGGGGTSDPTTTSAGGSASTVSTGGGGSGGMPPQGGAGGTDIACATDELTYGGHCYIASTVATTWDQARSICQARGAGWDLATVTSQGELDFIDGFITATMFLGATDTASDGNYVWITGETWSFAPWATGEPGGSTSQNCLGVNVEDSLFHDHTCSSNDHYLCERH